MYDRIISTSSKDMLLFYKIKSLSFHNALSRFTVNFTKIAIVSTFG